LAAVINGEGPAPRLVLALVKRLPDDSMTAASASGGIEHFGWGTTRYLLADIFDAIQQNTRACGNWKSRPPKLPKWPRPKGRKARKPTSVADLYRRLGG
jgi:hypothetical protein